MKGQSFIRALAHRAAKEVKQNLLGQELSRSSLQCQYVSSFLFDFPCSPASKRSISTLKFRAFSSDSILSEIPKTGQTELLAELETGSHMDLPGILRSAKQMTLDEVAHVQGFMRLLMKQRNGAPWSTDDKAAILSHLKHFGRRLPYLALFTLPGAAILLPGLAWFLDRRKYRNSDIATPHENTKLVSMSLSSPEDKVDQRL